MSLTIGIDVRKIRDGGIGRYLEGLLAALSALDGPERYVLFASDAARDTLPGSLPTSLEAPRFRLVRCDAPLYSMRELFAFRGAARRFGLDVLHFPHYVRALAPGCAVAVTIHDAIHLSHPPSLPAAIYARAMLTWSARSAAVLFTPSSAARSDVARRLDVPESRFRVAPNGVDARFAPPPAAGVASFRAARALALDYVLCLGTHRPHKNVAAAIEGFVAAALPNAEIVICASEERSAERFRVLERPGVRVLANVGDRELPLLYGGARIVLAPSLAEGFGLGPLEACACGAPVLATGIPAHREVLGDAVSWLDASGRSAEIAAGLASLWGDEARRAELARRGPDHARSYPWNRTAVITRDGYRAAGAPRTAQLPDAERL